MLLANIVDDLNLHVPDSQVPVAFFFCRHDVSESLKARTVIGSLARQLLRPIPFLQTEPLAGTRITDSERILDILNHSIPSDFRAYIVLDGLDECEEKEVDILVQFLQTLQGRLRLSLCISFRAGVESSLILSPSVFLKSSTVMIPDDNPDVAGFISAQLEKSIESGKLRVGDPALILEIEDALLQGTQGMFLWVALQISSLYAAKTDEAIRQVLADLPKDLPETFARIIRRAGKAGQDYQKRIFKLVTAAQRPLTIEELREALNVTPGDTTWNPARSINHIHSTLAFCGDLIIVDEETLTVKLVHHSVKQFLLGGGMFTVSCAQLAMAEVIVTYLNYGVFDTSLSTSIIPQIPTGAAASRIINSMDTSNSVRSLALKLLRSRRHSSYSMGKTLVDAARYRPPTAADQFHFYTVSGKVLFVCFPFQYI